MVREAGWYINKVSYNVKKTVQYMATATILKEGELFSMVCKKESYQILAISMHDINKALEVKPDQSPDDIKESHSSIFPPHRPSDMKINLQKDEKGREQPIPWGSL